MAQIYWSSWNEFHCFCFQVKYHEEYEKSLKGKRIEIADDPEIVRNMKNMQVQSNVAYHGELDKKQNMDQHRPATENNGYPTPSKAPLFFCFWLKNIFKEILDFRKRVNY